MNDLERAKTLLLEGKHTCVLCKGERAYTSNLRGVAPMVEFLSSGLDLKGFSAADKVVGKALAFLFVLAGVEAVYAPVMSEGAAEVFARYGIPTSCGPRVDMVINRAGDGPCPMERAVREIDDPQAAFEAVKRTQAALKAAAKVETV